MKILQINVVYGIGSTGKIVKDIHESLLNNGVNSFVLYGRGKKTNNIGVSKISNEFYSHLNKLYSKLSGLAYGGCYFSTKKITRFIKKWKPNIVHLHCLNGHFVNIYKLISWLKKHHIKTVLTLHAEFMFTANCGYAYDCEKWKVGCGKCPRYRKETSSILFDRTHCSWKRMKKAFDNFDELLIVSVSPWLMNRAKMSPFLFDRTHKVILNGLDNSIFYPRKTDEIREHLISNSNNIALYVSSTINLSPNHIKGAYYIFELAKKMPFITFFIVGPSNNFFEKPDNIILLGNITDQNILAELYSIADITLLTSKKETFSMIIAESLCCGTPVVAFEAGGPESVFVCEWVKFVKYGNLDEMCMNINDVLKHGFSRKQISEYAQNSFSKSRFVDDYYKLYKSLC